MLFNVAAAAALSLLPLLSLAAPVDNAQDEPRIDYDAIIVGGGPAGLSALSALARVRRNVLLVDSGVYRNGATRHMHDVIGFDGVTPSYYRWAARKLISNYGTVSMTNGTVTKIQPEQNNTYFTVTGKYPDDKELTYTARKIVLGTGLKDVLPDTPGLKENWSKGIFWCPWCDGHEHADQPFGIIGPLTKLPGNIQEIATLNTDVIGFTNGTDTEENRKKTEQKFPNWEKWLKLKNVKIDNRIISSIERLRNASTADADPSQPSHPEQDLFRVHFTEGEPVIRAAFMTSFDSVQYSPLGEDMGVNLYGDALGVDVSQGLMTNIPGVFAIGDCNSENVTNVPHALYSGKKTGVYLHIDLEQDAFAAALNKTQSKREVHEEARSLWDRMNGKPHEILYAGPFDQ